MPINKIGSFPLLVNPSMLQAVTKIYRHRASTYVNPERSTLAVLKQRALLIWASAQQIPMAAVQQSRRSKWRLRCGRALCSHTTVAPICE